MTVRAFRHVGITVSDLERSVAFYRDYLGLNVDAEFRGQASDYIRTLVGEPGAEIDVIVMAGPDGARIELLCYLSHPAVSGKPARAIQTGRPHLAFTVADIRDLYERRNEWDCVFKSPPLKSPDGVLVAYAHDPDGTILELVQPLDSK